MRFKKITNYQLIRNPHPLIPLPVGEGCPKDRVRDWVLLLGLVLTLVICLPSEARSAKEGHFAQADVASEITRVISSEGSKVGVAFIGLKTGQAMSINGTQEFPAASVIKVPIMAAAYHLEESGQLDLERKIVLKKEDKLGGSGILQWQRPGRAYTLRNLIRCMIMFSDNTATQMVISAIGLPEINNYIRSSGLTKTIVRDVTMLKEPPEPDINITTPLDMAHLLTGIKNEEMLYFMKHQKYRWGIPRGIANNAIVADKTGNLKGILNDTGIVYTNAGDYILSIFTYGYETQKQAREVINKISQAVYEEYTGTKVIFPKKKVKKRKFYRRRYRRYR